MKKTTVEVTGTCIIKKISNKNLNNKTRINTREISVKNILRKFAKKFG